MHNHFVVQCCQKCLQNVSVVLYFVCVHKFPQNEQLRKLWSKFVILLKMNWLALCRLYKCSVLNINISYTVRLVWLVSPIRTGCVKLMIYIHIFLVYRDIFNLTHMQSYDTLWPKENKNQELSSPKPPVLQTRAV